MLLSSQTSLKGNLDKDTVERCQEDRHDDKINENCKVFFNLKKKIQRTREEK